MIVRETFADKGKGAATGVRALGSRVGGALRTLAGGLFIVVCAVAYRAHPVAIFEGVDAAGFTMAAAVGEDREQD